ncbi:MAG: hypothetical protein A2402_00840 [Candidatus Staskawiczbacteria bacterium RIFOXYC1_FULL_37_43]|nr:MAG: hypothetical protein A2813_00660 [Candidatus Staskawiczbacteria bacterium RIFCSPHIGHO2_01_FULL_37_17]OGZ71438.1 MAG: hypothetical protein A2891_00820 [Candidatus Staskawiczbacteria bacterium RIFCSPLOWO2_01_FULL_37_19]OGZ76167.1 MAG: hypothetical protein A2205_03915 [Candidatus Staskawiczbacteria bacterium RIFOXYA1_FULL_37_15]OGZ77033.1 MAG: hypothetical protein A2280_00915 [Candidatus Staskawiczbacteria bacterium RIFOXYA12_FULL_37_10]OGZ80136.1 MAG: hypothetical protein A2353_02630 [Can
MSGMSMFPSWIGMVPNVVIQIVVTCPVCYVEFALTGAKLRCPNEHLYPNAEEALRKAAKDQSKDDK